MKAAILRQINDITSALISVSLSVEQHFPSEQNGTIYISGKHDLSVALKNVPYQETYKILDTGKNFNIKLVDGGLLQLMYQFEGDERLSKHRLAFFPSPFLQEFQNNSEIYETDELYADVIHKNIVPTPIRFDYDPANFFEINHPRVHLTIGQYQNCRIPVASPITPKVFVDFILRSFYNTATNKFTERLRFANDDWFDECIEESEQRLLHLTIIH
jgi:hypothetical protein